jgi:uncharacterized membrane-anchored protein
MYLADANVKSGFSSALGSACHCRRSPREDGVHTAGGALFGLRASPYDDPLMKLGQRTAVKVPEITVYFWIIKLLTTAMGEATSDYLVKNFNRYLAVLFGAVVLVAALALQFSKRRYIPWVYWLTVAMVAVSGTMAADVLHIQFNVPYIASSILYAVVLAAVFLLWNRTEKTLSIHSIYTPRREAFYWATVMATFALGTAFGDFTASTLNLGYLTSAIAFAVLFLVPAIGFWRFRMNGILAFWMAYVITRPIGASFADYMSKNFLGGLGWGDGHVAIYLTIAIVALVAFLTVTGQDLPKESGTPLAA